MTEPALREVRTVNKIGLGLFGRPGEKMEDLMVYEENGSVHIWLTFEKGKQIMQYLSPDEAMRFSQALDRCAIAALRNLAK